jgi:serine phosphatase RsbU (regulator of sigma subunit)
MSRPFPFLQPGDTLTRALRRWITGTFAGRAIALGLAAKLLSLMLEQLSSATAAARVFETAGAAALAAGAFALVYRVYKEYKGIVLWRVRRKLTLSYIFIGFVPALLIIVLFATLGFWLFYNVGMYMARRGIDSAVERAAFLAESTAFGLQSSESVAELRERLERRQAAAERSYPFVSYAVVPATRLCTGGDRRSSTAAADRVLTAGAWRHLDPPTAIPASVECAGVAALLVYRETPGADGGDRAGLVARAVAWPDEAQPQFAVVVDLPFSAKLLERVRADTGIDLGDVTQVEVNASRVGPDAKPTPDEAACAAPLLSGRPLESAQRQAPQPDTRNPLRRPIQWGLFFKFRDWPTGASCDALAAFGITIADLYARVSDPARAGPVNVNRVLLVLIGLIGALLLVIQIAAFIMGLSLARSITGSIHELFTGTERVRLGDFTHKIAIRSRDQLGELAESFNSMTSSIEDLLQQKAEKERLEQELRIARTIQMSLLPHGGLNRPGLSVTAHCEPAREVGGDYYDYLPIDDHRVGLLIADVAGKGTSAALYMAELKGLMLSLTQLHTSPRRLLIDANRIIARHLDSRSFITITYAVVDLEAKTLTYARAGHCPLIYVPGPHAASRRAQILAPDGLVLGLQIDNGERFNRLLTESSIRLGTGDIFLFYTDGLTEAMDADGNIFGDARLATMVQEHADLPFEELRERIMREVSAFSGPVLQHDDMTILLLKVEDVGSHLPAGTARNVDAEAVGAGRGRR